MIGFAALIERLQLTPSRNAKIALMVRYFDAAPDPDRGWALAALAGELKFTAAKAGLIRELAVARCDPVLFGWSYDFVGDLAETTALMWPAAGGRGAPGLHEVVEVLAGGSRKGLGQVLEGWLDGSEPAVRYAILKLITGGLRAGASARLAKSALAAWSAEKGAGVSVEDIEEVWHGLSPPYAGLFAWVEGKGAAPVAQGAVFRPPMLAHPLEEEDLAGISPELFAAEWKWDGIRVQLAAGPGGAKLFSRGADDISAAFPEVVARAGFDAVVDGELLVVRDGEVAPFADVQQRLNRKSASLKLQAEFPAFIRAYDLLFEAGEDLRGLGFAQRRARLEDWFARVRPAGMDISAVLAFADVEELARLRDAGGPRVEGVMLKRLDAPYVAGRPKGLWWKWKRAPHCVDAVLMYAQRGHGRRSSFYSDYTFGVWREDGELVPVGKAYSGYSDAELEQLDRWIRHNTVRKYGPVREVARGLVLEVAFDGVQRSGRHKSGVALRFPRISRLRWDKPVAEADRLEVLERKIG